MQKLILFFIYEYSTPRVNSVLCNSTMPPDKVYYLFSRIKANFSDEEIIQYFEKITPKMVETLDLIFNWDYSIRCTIRSMWNSNYCTIHYNTRRVEWYI